MIDPKILDEISNKIGKLIPESVKDLQKDLEANIKTILQNAFAKLDLVTRDEFDVQTKVLARSREKLELLEKRIAELEQQIKK